LLEHSLREKEREFTLKEKIRVSEQALNEKRREFELQEKYSENLLKATRGSPVTNYVVNTYNTTNIQMNVLYMDYPKNETTTKVLQKAQAHDLGRIKSVQDLDDIIGHVQDMNGGEIVKCLVGADQKAKSQALSFLADVMRTLRQRLQQTPASDKLLIEAAEDFEKDCLRDKQKITPQS
jgi:hypothetical protein